MTTRIASLPATERDAGPSIRQESEDGVHVLYLHGAWRLANLAGVGDALREVRVANAPVVLDGRGLDDLDTAGAFTLLRRLMQAGCSEAALSARRFTPRHERLLALVCERMQCPPATGKSAHPGLLQHIGFAAVTLGRTLKVHIAFLGVVVLELLRLVQRPSLFRVKETVSQFQTICIDAIPIVALVNFLIGIVFAYLLGLQAQRYGANIFVVDGVGLAICREMAPLLVAVIVAGRSGAAFTAQIGTMKVQEEIDAIATLGLSPIQVLVLPRLFAIVVALPLLVFVGDVFGIAGGMLVAAWQLDIHAASFLDRLHAVLPLSAPVVGLAKAPVFAAFIGLIACRMGMTVARDARSVGVNTTSTVVQSIVWVIVLDAIFAVVLQGLGI